MGDRFPHSHRVNSVSVNCPAATYRARFWGFPAKTSVADSVNATTCQERLVCHSRIPRAPTSHRLWPPPRGGPVGLQCGAGGTPLSRPLPHLVAISCDLYRLCFALRVLMFAGGRVEIRLLGFLVTATVLHFFILVSPPSEMCMLSWCFFSVRWQLAVPAMGVG